MRTELSEGGLRSQELASAQKEEGEEEEVEKEIDSADCSSSPYVVRWERFLSKMAVRVLLVEADDSTRQIIAALLRKCSYRVAAVGDGLKAWELIKGSPEKIDLILTEVELPSISGYALLTLIMENDACKNIPVIMMSSNDSISTVYKCMLRGATDFLVKPIRKNELRNLWQHLWRKQASSNSTGSGPPDESVVQAQPKAEATAENNGYVTAQRNGECVEDESSCGKLDLETEGTLITTRLSNQEIRGLEIEEGRSEDSEVKPAVAIDLIGTFGKGSYGLSVASKAISDKFGSSQFLDLSLKGSDPIRPSNPNDDGRHRLNHSNSSAFSWYVNKPLQPNTPKSPETYDRLEKQQSFICSRADRNPDEKHLSSAESQKPEIPFFHRPQNQEISNQIHSSPLQPSDQPLSIPRQFHGLRNQTAIGGHEFENSENQVQAAPGNNNVCNESTFSGNNGKINEECFQAKNCNRAYHRSLQREAALTKFRLKRKDRCFEKKVRYESRKKLAEQRPRVKGQFVRQVPGDPQPGNSSADQ